MKNIGISGQALSYRDEGQGPPLILLHANPGDSRDFDAITPPLAKCFRVLRLDWPGYGASPAPQPCEKAGAGYYLDMLAALIEQLDLRDIVLLGNSVGGNAAVRYVLKAPERVRGLILVSPGGFTPHNFVTRAFCTLQGKPRFNRLIGGLFTRAYLRRRNEHTRAMIARADGEQNSDVARCVNAAVWRSFLEPQHDLRVQAQALRVPALVVSGKYDPVIPANKDGRIAAATIPGAQQIVMHSGHAPFAEIPEEFLAAIQPFLDRLREAG